MAPNRTLITGMSGTGKSTTIEQLVALGFAGIDTDSPRWKRPPGRRASAQEEVQPDWLWDTDKMTDLLERFERAPLFVAGTVENQGGFYDRFQQVVLLSAPLEVMLRRVNTRQGGYGSSAADRARITRDHAEFEPVLRRRATLEIVTIESPTSVVGRALEHAGLGKPDRVSGNPEVLYHCRPKGSSPPPVDRHAGP